MELTAESKGELIDMYTYQDFENDIKEDKAAAVGKAIREHQQSDLYSTAKIADEYDHHRNVTINNYVRTIFSAFGEEIDDFTASNNKIASNFFRRLNTQRCVYSLGNGVSFTKHIEKYTDEDGIERLVDRTKERLGNRFDADLKKTGYLALIHGVCFGFWNVDRLHVFPITEFAPLWDEETGVLRAGVRFWQVDRKKPMMATLYEENGYTRYKSDSGNESGFEAIDRRPQAYRKLTARTVADGDYVIGEMNYGSLPIVPLWGSDLHQSTLVGMQEAIDSFDLIRSGFANDLSDCTQIYWILENYGGMKMEDLIQLRDKMRITHFIPSDTDNGKITPYTQEIPYEARKAYLDDIRAGIYEDFGGLDVHAVQAGSTNDHITAAYQPMDENADEYEYQLIEFVQQILSLLNIEDTPIFVRNRISNESERTTMVLAAADYLDEETILRKLPFITIDEVPDILKRLEIENMARLEDEEERGGGNISNTEGNAPAPKNAAAESIGSASIGTIGAYEG